MGFEYAVGFIREDGSLFVDDTTYPTQEVPLELLSYGGPYTHLCHRWVYPWGARPYGEPPRSLTEIVDDFTRHNFKDYNGDQ